jgi:hypothetical protein
MADTRYVVASAGDLDSLAIEVNKYIQGGGWKPQGGVCAYQVTQRDSYGNQHTELWFSQAMIL